MAASELDRDGDALFLGKEPLLRHVRLATDLDLQRRMSSDVAWWSRCPAAEMRMFRGR